jgi:hypothetical protein
MTKKRKTHDPAPSPRAGGSLGYIVFYLLFSPDFWRLLIGVGAAAWVAPRIFQPEMSAVVRGMLYIMLTAIGWAASGVPARWLCRKLKQLVLGDRAGRGR